MATATERCPNKLEDSEQPCGDEGRLCEACQEKESEYWWNYFGASKSSHQAFGEFYGWKEKTDDL